MPRPRLLLPLLAISALLAACETTPQAPPREPWTLLPSPRDPAAATPPIRVVDGRPHVRREAVQGEFSLTLGEAVYAPGAAEFVAATLPAALAADAAHAPVAARLRGRTVLLEHFEISLGPRMPPVKPAPSPRVLLLGVSPVATIATVLAGEVVLSRLDAAWAEAVAKRWEVVRVHVVVSVDGRRFEGADVHTYNRDELPSPIATPSRVAVENLVRSMLLFDGD